MKALITGASSGMGKEFAKILAKTYDEIVLVARNKERLEEVKNELAPVKVKVISLDVSNRENCIKLHEQVKDVDLLINNAGFGDYGSFTETDLGKELSMIDTNIAAYHILTKLYLKDMRKKNSGHILNVASIAGFMPGPLMTTYYATKSYVVRMSEGIREELKKEKSKVKISILCPGPVKTNFEKSANIKFNFNGTDSRKVCEYTIKHLNKFYIVPGITMKMARITAGIVPSSLAGKAVYSLQSKRKGE